MRQPPTIDAYGAGGFRVSGVWMPGSLLILDDIPTSWTPASLSVLRVEHFASVIAAGAAVSEFVLLGTGADQALPPREIREAISRAGMGLEFMATPRAAQAWDVLTSEGRRVAAALIAI